MSKNRYAARIDENQPEIVKQLRKIPGFSVELNHGDFLLGYRGVTFWYELKSDRVISKKTKKILESGIKKSQKKLRSEWKGHYKIVSSFDEIFNDVMSYFTATPPH